MRLRASNQVVADLQVWTALSGFGRTHLRPRTHRAAKKGAILATEKPPPMQEHYAKIRRGETDIPLIAGNREDRLSGLDLLLKLEPGFTVLDIGCHEAFIAEALALSGAGLIHGMDLHEPSLELARRRMAEHNAVLKRVDLCEGMPALRRELPLLPKYDVVLYLGIYQHMVRQMPPEAVSAFVSELFPMAQRYIAIRTPLKFWSKLREEPVMRGLRLVHQDDRNPAVSPLEIYEPK